jgi:hypothetical protein
LWQVWFDNKGKTTKVEWTVFGWIEHAYK